MKKGTGKILRVGGSEYTWKTMKGFLMKDKFPFTEAFGAVNRAWESHHEDFFGGKQIVFGLLVLEVVLLPQPRKPGWRGGWERLSRLVPQCLFPHDSGSSDVPRFQDTSQLGNTLSFSLMLLFFFQT